MIDVEVVYCPKSGVVDRVELSLPAGSTLRVALDASGLLARHGLTSASLVVGVWGRQQGLDAMLRSRDRVEIYRPLQCDPKEARRLRYRAKALAGKGAKA
jgi:putative ubiquitin-RnfH superfamily antitoxin RatB of RatAB toxin-antitoxin module